MEIYNSEDVTQEDQRFRRNDSVMAPPNIEERLRRLEDAHSVHGPAHNNSPLICNASLKHTQQISDLGVEFNALDEAIHALEQANNDREFRVRKLEQRLYAFESMQAVGRSDDNQHQSAEDLIKAEPHPAISQFGDELDVQKATLNGIAIKLSQLEKNFESSLSASTTHAIAQTLVQRLGNGDELEAMVKLQLQATLQVRGSPLPTPAPTNTARRESMMRATTSEEPLIKVLPGRPRKRPVTEPVDNEPLPKRLRDDTPRTASSDSLSVKSEPKRGRGRPRKDGGYERKSSSESIASSTSNVAPPAPMLPPISAPIPPAMSASMSASMPAPRFCLTKTPVKKKGTATKLTKTVLNKRMRDGEPTPEVSQHWRDRQVSGSTNSEASVEQSEVITPKRTIRLLTGAMNGADSDTKSDEPIVVATKAEPAATPQSSTLVPGCDRTTASRNSVSTRPNIATPKRKIPVPREATPLSQSFFHGLGSETPGKKKARSSPGYSDMETPDLTAMKESTADGLDIPPERRSSRKPKATKHFGDMVSWKEANPQVAAMRPSAPLVKGGSFPKAPLAEEL